jgi:hypothetical protein
MRPERGSCAGGRETPTCWTPDSPGSGASRRRRGFGPRAGESWEPVRLLCMVYDPAEPRAALRLGVETPGTRFVYTFWYRLMEAPLEDSADPPAAPDALP